jgi:hypothetical protein
MATSTTAIGNVQSTRSVWRRLSTSRRLFWALVLLNAADLATTALVLDRGGSERNPLVEPLIHGMWGAVTIKIACLGLVAALLNRCAASARARVFLAAAATWYGFVVVWNVTVLVRLR